MAAPRLRFKARSATQHERRTKERGPASARQAAQPTVMEACLLGSVRQLRVLLGQKLSKPWFLCGLRDALWVVAR